MTQPFNHSYQRSLDTEIIASSNAFAELVRRRTLLVSTLLFLAASWFATFILLSAFAHDLMATMLWPGMSLAYVLGLSQFISVWIVTAIYLRASTRTFVPLQDEALSHILPTPSSSGATS